MPRTHKNQLKSVSVNNRILLILPLSNQGRPLAVGFDQTTVEFERPINAHKLIFSNIKELFTSISFITI